MCHSTAGKVFVHKAKNNNQNNKEGQLASYPAYAPHHAHRLDACVHGIRSSAGFSRSAFSDSLSFTVFDSCVKSLRGGIPPNANEQDMCEHAARVWLARALAAGRTRAIALRSIQAEGARAGLIGCMEPLPSHLLQHIMPAHKPHTAGGSSK